MLQKMKRIQVVGPKDELNRVVDLLYSSGTVHLENANETINPDEIPLIPVEFRYRKRDYRCPLKDHGNLWHPAHHCR